MKTRTIFNYDLVLETEWNMKRDPREEGKSDVNLGVLGSVKSLKISWFVDWDVAVDCHEDDDVDGARHEGVDQGQFQMSLVEGDGVGVRVKTFWYIIESGNGANQNTEIGHGQSQQVHVHHTWTVESLYEPH